MGGSPQGCISVLITYFNLVHHNRLGFGPSCGARRMAESTSLLVEDVFQEAVARVWALGAEFRLDPMPAQTPGNCLHCFNHLDADMMTPS